MGRDLEHDGASYRLASFDQLGSSPAEPGALRAMADLIEWGWASYSILSWTDPVAALTTPDGKVVSAIVWRRHEVTPTASVILGYTAPDWRRRGLYARLFQGFAEALAARHPELRAIESGFHDENLASARMHVALGRPVVGHLTRYDLEEVRRRTFTTERHHG